MDLRPAFAISLLLLASLAFAPGASAAPCDTSAPTVGCQATVGRCDVAAGGNVITATHAGASADCRFGNMTRCFVGVGLSASQFPVTPSVDRWCAF